MTKPDHRDVVDRLVRRQRSRLVAQLLARFGSQHLTLIEDATQDAIVSALEHWMFDGVPDNPGAWLHRVSSNRAIDLLRKIKPELPYDVDFDTRFDETDRRDPELHLLLLCCQQGISALDQHLLMLNLVLGLTHQEVANLTLSSTARISQRLARAKRKLKRGQVPDIDRSAEPQMGSAEIDTLAQTIYTSFNIGYFPRQGEQLIRQDVAREALRLAETIATDPRLNQNESGSFYALSALLSFQASRFAAREDTSGHPVLFVDQDRGLWDYQLIDRGNEFLLKSRAVSQISPFHLEAAIAALHVNLERTDWNAIDSLYESLLRIKATPGIRISAAVAKTHNHQPDAALQALEKLEQDFDLKNYAPLHLARAEALRKLGHEEQAKAALDQALCSENSLPISKLIMQKRTQ